MVATLANNIPMFGMMKQMDTAAKSSIAPSPFPLLSPWATIRLRRCQHERHDLPDDCRQIIGGVTAIGVAMMLVPKEDARRLKPKRRRNREHSPATERRFDIGTTTTQVIFSHLELVNRRRCRRCRATNSSNAKLAGKAGVLYPCR